MGSVVTLVGLFGLSTRDHGAASAELYSPATSTSSSTTSTTTSSPSTSVVPSDPAESASSTTEPDTITTVENTTTTDPFALVVPSTTILVDSPLFVSADYPAVIVPGTTATFTVVCSRPIGLGDSPSVEVSGIEQEDLGGFTAWGGDVTLTPTGFTVTWDVPVDQPVGEYGVQLNCDGPTDVIELGVVYPPGAFSPEFPVRVGAEPTTVIPPTQ